MRNTRRMSKLLEGKDLVILVSCSYPKAFLQLGSCEDRQEREVRAVAWQHTYLILR